MNKEIEQRLTECIGKTVLGVSQAHTKYGCDEISFFFEGTRIIFRPLVDASMADDGFGSIELEISGG
jgi:hypothetical protein